jgi:hypothetical protein
VYERLQKHGQALAAKLEQKRSEHAEKEAEGATFKPEVPPRAVCPGLCVWGGGEGGGRSGKWRKAAAVPRCSRPSRVHPAVLDF